MTAAYFGAGTDIRPIKFCEVDTYYYVDSQPYSEFGLRRAKEWKDGVWTGKYTKGFSRPRFIPELDQQMASIDMKLLKVEGDIRTYTNGKKTVIYHTNTSIPEHCEKIRKVVEDCDTLIVAGHHPHSTVVHCFNNLVEFIGLEGTCFSSYIYDDLEKHSINNELHEGGVRHKFKSYTYLSNQGTCHKFKTWEAFTQYATEIHLSTPTPN